MLIKEEKRELLKIARQSIASYFVNEVYQPAIKLANLNRPAGVFVTLKINSHLRGCIGLLETKKPLYQTITRMAQSAAFDDWRFPPLTAEELKKTTIEISVLSPLKKISDPSKEIKIGQHGVIVKSKTDQRTGVFLPQVALENNLNLEEFMNELCQNKAGLPKEAWKENKVDIYVFTAAVFSEKDL